MTKRCMTRLDDDVLAELETLERLEDRNESQMIAVLVKEAIAVRRSASRAKSPRQPMRADGE